MWIAALLATPVVQAQESWSAEQQAARDAALTAVFHEFGTQVNWVSLGDTRFAGTSRARQLVREMERRPGEDPVPQGLEAILDHLDGLAQTYHQEQAALRALQDVRMADQERFEENLRAVQDSVLVVLLDFDRRCLGGVSEPSDEAPLYSVQRGAFPGPPSAIPGALRADFAFRYMESVRGLAYEGAAQSLGVLGDGIDAAEVAELQATLRELHAAAAEVGPWFGDGQLAQAAEQVLSACLRWAEGELPQLLVAFGAKDFASVNTGVAAMNVLYFELISGLNAQAQAFAQSWQMHETVGQSLVEEASYLEEQARVVAQRRQADRALHDTPEGQRYQELTRVAGLYIEVLKLFASVDFGDGVAEVEGSAARKLAAADAELQALGPGNDPYTAALEQLSQYLHWEVEEMFPAGVELFREPHPREEHHQRAVELYGEETRRLAEVMEGLEAGHDAYARELGITLGVESQRFPYTVRSLELSSSLPGPETTLPQVLGTLLAVSHSNEVWGLWEQGQVALFGIMEAEVEQVRRAQLDHGPRLDLALSQVREVPAWRGDSTLVDGAVRALELLSETAHDNVPALMAFADSPGRRSGKRYDKAWSRMDRDYLEAARIIEEAYAEFAEAWAFDSLELWGDEGA